MAEALLSADGHQGASAPACFSFFSTALQTVDRDSAPDLLALGGDPSCPGAATCSAPSARPRAHRPAVPCARPPVCQGIWMLIARAVGGTARSVGGGAREPRSGAPPRRSGDLPRSPWGSWSPSAPGQMPRARSAMKILDDRAAEHDRVRRHDSSRRVGSCCLAAAPPRPARLEDSPVVAGWSSDGLPPRPECFGILDLASMVIRPDLPPAAARAGLIGVLAGSPLAAAVTPYLGDPAAGAGLRSLACS